MRSSKRFEQNTLKLRVRLFRITQNRTGVNVSIRGQPQCRQCACPQGGIFGSFYILDRRGEYPSALLERFAFLNSALAMRQVSSRAGRSDPEMTLGSPFSLLVFAGKSWMKLAGNYFKMAKNEIFQTFLRIFSRVHFKSLKFYFLVCNLKKIYFNLNETFLCVYYLPAQNTGEDLQSSSYSSVRHFISAIS